MQNDKKTILRTVRLTPTLSEEIECIAKYEGRTIANTIQRLLLKAVDAYYKNCGEEFLNFLKYNPNGTLNEFHEVIRHTLD